MTGTDWLKSTLPVLMTGTLLLTQGVRAQQKEPARPRITGLAHVAVFSKDYQKSRAFYRDFLGFEEPYSLQNADGTPSMTFFKVNERQYIELFPEKEANSDRLSHISIETDDIEAMRLYLAARGITVPDKVPRGRIKNANFSIKDPDGHGVEIVQYMPDGFSAREKGKYMPATRISNHILHAGVVVADLDRALKFYTGLLGFREFYRGSKSGTVLSWVNLKVPDGEDYVEFMLFKDSPTPTERLTAHHMALEVPDVAAAVAVLEARPSRKQYPHKIESHVGVNRRRQANLYDPDGTRTELMEPTTIDGKPPVSSTAPPPQ